MLFLASYEQLYLWIVCLIAKENIVNMSEGGREGGRERGREGGREEGREGEREGGREEGREGGREGERGRVRGGRDIPVAVVLMWRLLFSSRAACRNFPIPSFSPPLSNTLCSLCTIRSFKNCSAPEGCVKCNMYLQTVHSRPLIRTLIVS